MRPVFAIAAALVVPLTAFPQINVITSGGFAAPLQAILPGFEKATGIKVVVTRGQSQGTTPTVIGAQLRRGVACDVVIMSKEGLSDLIAEGRIAAGTAADLAQTPIGISVRAGAVKPDISTVEAFKQTLLRAKSITFPSSTTGIYMTTKLFPQLGIASEVAAKTTNTGIVAVAAGEAEIAIQPVSELLNVKGTEYAGTIPAEIQYISVFSAAIVGNSKQQAEAKRLIAYLTSDAAKTSIRNYGMTTR